jgi:hypothetical protein
LLGLALNLDPPNQLGLHMWATNALISFFKRDTHQSCWNKALHNDFILLIFTDPISK